MSARDLFEKAQDVSPRQRFEDSGDVGEPPPAEPSTLDRIGDYLKNSTTTDTLLRGHVLTSVPYSAYKLATDPTGERDRLRAAVEGGTFGAGSSALARLSGDPSIKAEYQQDAEKYPVQATAGSLAAPIPGAKSGALPRIVGAGALGGAQGYFSSKPGEEMAGTAVGMGAGLAGGALGEGVSKLAGKLAPNRYMKAAGFIQKDLGKKNMSPERQADLAKWLETSSPPIIPPGAGKADIAERLKSSLSKSGGTIAAERTGLDAARTPLDWDAVHGALQSSLDARDPLARRAVSGEYADALAAAQEAKTKGLGYESLGAMKGTAQDLTDYDTNKSKLANNARKAIAGTLREQEERQISANAPGVAQSLQPAFRDYRNAASVLPATTSAIARERGNDPLGIVGKGLVGAGLAGAGYDAMTGGQHHEATAPAIAAGVGLAIANRRGSALAAPLLSGARAAGPRLGRGFADWLSREDAKDRLKNDR